MSKRQKHSQKHLKQTTLLESLSSPSRPSPSKPPKRKKDPEAPSISRKRRKRSPQPNADESDSDVGAIKFVDQMVDSDQENKASQPSPKKRRKIVVLGSDEEESDAAPVFKRQKKKEEPVPAPSSKGKARAKPRDTDSDEEDVAPRKTKSRLHKGSRKKPTVQDDSDELEQERGYIEHTLLFLPLNHLQMLLRRASVRGIRRQLFSGTWKN